MKHIYQENNILEYLKTPRTLEEEANLEGNNLEEDT